MQSGKKEKKMRENVTNRNKKGQTVRKKQWKKKEKRVKGQERARCKVSMEGVEAAEGRTRCGFNGADDNGAVYNGR